jgi:hypothetical protein
MKNRARDVPLNSISSIVTERLAVMKSCAKSMSILVAGKVLRIWQMASKPLTSGMVTSIKTNAERSFLTIATA